MPRMVTVAGMRLVAVTIGSSSEVEMQLRLFVQVELYAAFASVVGLIVVVPSGNADVPVAVVACSPY